MRPRRHLLSIALGGMLLLTMTSTRAHAQLAREMRLIPDSSIAMRAPVLPTESGFALDQMRHDRVLDARIATRFNIKRLFHERGIRYPAAEVYVRIFKRERSLELWVRETDAEQFELLKTYTICAWSGELGPKRRQGDNQTPEGFYQVDFFNPRSDYHLSLHLDYPNARDRAAGATGLDLGGDIFIHGGCNSAGCLALTDDGIKELYWVAVEARAVGQQRIPVHIFPARLEDTDLAILNQAFANDAELTSFWNSLKPGYDFFEQNRRVPAIAVDARGNYRVNGAAAAPAPLGEPLGAPANGTAPKPKPGPLGSPAGG
ncbi:MAG TPA: L,D-transpeptidase family protein [Longimicrobiales bacterium]|nr:L,D-transpeptidase family protein [Longimicrobiales bacterium]